MLNSVTCITYTFSNECSKYIKYVHKCVFLLLCTLWNLYSARLSAGQYTVKCGGKYLKEIIFNYFGSKLKIGNFPLVYTCWKNKNHKFFLPIHLFTRMGENIYKIYILALCAGITIRPLVYTTTFKHAILCTKTDNAYIIHNTDQMKQILLGVQTLL